MANRLKHFRVTAGMTQTEIARAVDVTQPTYQRWESGTATIPAAKLVKLAKILKTNKAALLGQHPAIEAAFYDDSAPQDLQYYGEVAIHFHGGGQSLLLSISEEARRRLFRNLRLAQKFITVRDLGNRTVAIRREAISDLYLSSEAYDDFGPEHNQPGYKDGTPLQFPDSRDWEIIECLACDSEGLEDFSNEDVERVERAILISDEQYEELVAEGSIKAENLEAEKAKNAVYTDDILALATNVIYQLSAGQQRRVSVIDSELYEAFGDLVDEDGENFDEDSSIILQSEGYHRAIYINADAVDYISIPTHLLEKSRDDLSAALLDGLDSAD